MGILRGRGTSGAIILALGAWSALFLAVLSVPPGRRGGPDDQAERAVRLMARSLDAVRAGRAAAGVPIDPRTDLNHTGLVGLENSPITTSLGQIEAKRTATNPQFAGAVVRMLREAGVRSGDAVAVGASSSFPGLFVAALCAVRAIDARALAILSLGASNWGGNDPRWTGLETVACLNRSGILRIDLLALSVGGEGDAGGDMTAEGRAFLRKKIAASGLSLVEEKTLADDVRARLALYDARAGGTGIRAFVNVGGSWVNMGSDPGILKLRPGFNSSAEVSVPPPGRRGLIQQMAARGIPVIHLLYVKGLADRYGLPWDPFPFPAFEQAPFGGPPGAGSRPAVVRAAAVYLLGVAAGAALILRRRRSLTV